MSSNDSHHHSKPSHTVFDRLTSKISAIKDDITDAVKDQKRSISSDPHSSISSASSLASMNSVAFSLQDDTSSITVHTRQSSKASGKCSLPSN
jgi:hypothetical protein